MSKYNRDIILLISKESIRVQEVEARMKHLREMIAAVQTIDFFCKTHELVARNRITRRRFKMIDALRGEAMKPFYFFINKN